MKIQRVSFRWLAPQSVRRNELQRKMEIPIIDDRNVQPIKPETKLNKINETSEEIKKDEDDKKRETKK